MTLLSTFTYIDSGKAFDVFVVLPLLLCALFEFTLFIFISINCKLYIDFKILCSIMFNINSINTK